MKRVRLIISGDVQGVGYRYWVVRQVRGKEITGWVKNRADGTVELVAEGSEADLTELIEQCKKGPEVSWVKDVQADWQKYQGEFSSFEIAY